MHPRSLTTEQTLTIRVAFDHMKHPYRIATTLMIEAGLRVGEVTQLAWLDITHLGAAKEAIEIAKTTSKNNRSRVVPCSRLLITVIQQTLAGWSHEQRPHPSNYVTARKRNGHPISVRSLEREVKTIGREALGIDLNPHMLRHTFATRLLAVSNTEIVRAALGHKRLSTTQIYIRASTDQVKEAIAKVP